MVDRDEDYNTRYAGYRGYLLAFERTKPIPRASGDLNLTAMIAAASADTADKVVDHFATRFLSRPARRRRIAPCSSSSCAGKLGSTSRSSRAKLELAARTAVSRAEHYPNISWDEERDGSRCTCHCSCSRRDFLARGLYGIGVGAGLPLFLSRTSAALAAQALQGTSVEKHPERILVVIELVGRQRRLEHCRAATATRPTTAPGRASASPEREVLKVADGFGFHPVDGRLRAALQGWPLAVVHGCGYDHPSLSHFSSMGYWHTGVPERRRAARVAGPSGRRDLRRRDAQLIVNIGNVAVARRPQRQALAARLRRSRRASAATAPTTRSRPSAS